MKTDRLGLRTKKTHSLLSLLIAAPLLLQPLEAAAVGKLPSIDNSLLKWTLVDSLPVKKQIPMTEVAAELQKKLQEKKINLRVVYKGEPGADVPLASIGNSDEESLLSILQDTCAEAACGYLLHQHTIIIYPDRDKHFQTTLKLPKGFIKSAGDILRREGQAYIRTSFGVITLMGYPEVNYNANSHELKLTATAEVLYHVNDFLHKCHVIERLDKNKYSLACNGKKFGECLNSLFAAMEPDFGKISHRLENGTFTADPVSEQVVTLPDIKDKTPRQILRELCGHVERDFAIYPHVPHVVISKPDSKLPIKTWKAELEPNSEGYDIDDASLLDYVASRNSDSGSSAHYDPHKKELTVRADEGTLRRGCRQGPFPEEEKEEGKAQGLPR